MGGLTHVIPLPMDSVVSRCRRLAAVIMLAFSSFVVMAQALPREIFREDEVQRFQLYFKWGLIMAKAGQAEFRMQSDTLAGDSVWHYTLRFQTAGLIERVFPMRDSLDGYFTKSDRLLRFATKHANEGDYYSVDELRFSYGEAQTEVHSRRYTLSRTKIDTLLVARQRVYDMLSATLYLRSLDWETLHIGREYPFQVAIGRDLVNTAFRYDGQQIVEYDGHSYPTRHFFVDVYDEAFTQSKAAGEVWMLDSPAHFPFKVRAKLKIGAAEAYLLP